MAPPPSQHSRLGLLPYFGDGSALAEVAVVYGNQHGLDDRLRVVESLTSVLLALENCWCWCYGSGISVN
jgi:hypothetical protein